MYNFDEIIERRGTNSSKWSDGEENPNMLCMNTADMDFRTAPCILEALAKRVEHGIFGYTYPPRDYFPAAVRWCETRRGFQARAEWMIQSPGVVYALKAVMHALTEEGDPVLLQPPVYTPFFNMIRSENRTLVENPLIQEEDGSYRMDYADLEEKLKKGVKLMMLCNPHNPVGRLWRKEELEQVLNLCAKYHTPVVSDDIHCDLIMPGQKYTSILSLNRFDVQMVQLVSLTKTFNIAGLHTSTTIIPDAELRKKVQQLITRFGPYEANIFGMEAQYAGYTQGAEWLDAVRTYVWENAKTLKEILSRQDVIHYHLSEGTYLAWLDCRRLNLDDEKLMDFFLKDCEISPVSGKEFGQSGYIRLNLACPRSLVAEAGRRLVEAVRKKQA